MNVTLIKNGRVIDPESGRDEVTDILIKKGVIEKIGAVEKTEEMELIDAKNKVVIPGLVDLHVHLRDFEQADKETIESGTRAALKGGVTTVLAMPNTKPPLDSGESIRAYQQKIRETSHINVLVAGAITTGLNGKELAPLEEYPQLGIRFITDDGFDVEDENLLEEAYQKAKELGLVVMTHPEIHSIAPNGVLNEGEISRSLGLPGQPNEKEYKAIERGLRLAKKTGARAHFTHISTRQSVELIRRAKNESDQISCDVTPHHFSLTQEVALEQGSFAKVNPPLRTEDDRQALIKGIKDGTIDAIATDHAPHTEKDKTKDVATSAFGISQIETSLATSLTELHLKQGIPLMKVIEMMTVLPSRLLGEKKGNLQEGMKADIVILDLETERSVNLDSFLSKGHNTPFQGIKLKGWPERTIL